MNMRILIQKYRRIMTVCLSIIGIAVIIFYLMCDTTCSYLHGDIFGIDLKYIGIGCMVLIIALSLLNQMKYVQMILAMGIGVELYLISFQFVEDVFCPYCIAFALTVILAFIITYEGPKMDDGRQRNIMHGLGSIQLGGITIPLLLLVILGYFLIVLTFSGSATPVYGIE